MKKAPAKHHHGPWVAISVLMIAQLATWVIFAHQHAQFVDSLRIPNTPPPTPSLAPAINTDRNLEDLSTYLDDTDQRVANLQRIVERLVSKQPLKTNFDFYTLYHRDEPRSMIHLTLPEPAYVNNNIQDFVQGDFASSYFGSKYGLSLTLSATSTKQTLGDCAYEPQPEIKKSKIKLNGVEYCHVTDSATYSAMNTNSAVDFYWTIFNGQRIQFEFMQSLYRHPEDDGLLDQGLNSFEENAEVIRDIMKSVRLEKN